MSLILIVGLTACTSPPVASPAPKIVPSAGCDAGISRAALPEWARGGFTGDGSGVAHRLSDRGDMMAILFEYPPVADADGAKILWVSRVPVETASPLVVDGVSSSGQTAHQELPNGAGPSTVTVPGPGCWDLTLTWSGHTDHLLVPFA